MNKLEVRIAKAQTLWQQGDAALAQDDLALAYSRYTEAHDLVTDCPAQHRRAHRKLAAVNRRNGRRGELMTDRFLLAAAPLGIFTVIAWFFRSSVTGSAPCKRAA